MHVGRVAADNQPVTDYYAPFDLLIRVNAAISCRRILRLDRLALGLPS